MLSFSFLHAKTQSEKGAKKYKELLTDYKIITTLLGTKRDLRSIGTSGAYTNVIACKRMHVRSTFPPPHLLSLVLAYPAGCDILA